jgi:CDP-diacylglycerol pyrophosphatase
VSVRAALAVALAALVATAAHAQDRDGLLRQMRACLAEATPAPPCTVVDRARGFVVIKDDSPDKPDAWLIVPTTPVTGIEDPRAWRPPVDEFWSWGFQIGRALLKRPPEDIGLAINSRAGRTQDLLHLHISCVAPAVRDALAAARIRPGWAAEPFVRYRGDAYDARTVPGLEPSPFVVLRELPGARADMAAQSLAAIGRADGGFYLLTDSTAPGVVAETEALLDQDCR